MNTCSIFFFAVVCISLQSFQVQAYHSVGVSFKWTDEKCNKPEMRALGEISQLVAVKGGYSEAMDESKWSDKSIGKAEHMVDGGRALETEEQLEEDEPASVYDDFVNMISGGRHGRKLPYGCCGECDGACLLCSSGAGFYCRLCACCNGCERRELRGAASTIEFTRELQVDLEAYAQELCEASGAPCVDCSTATVIEK